MAETVKSRTHTTALSWRGYHPMDRIQRMRIPHVGYDSPVYGDMQPARMLRLDILDSHSNAARLAPAQIRAAFSFACKACHVNPDEPTTAHVLTVTMGRHLCGDSDQILLPTGRERREAS